jgi:Fe2+ or Zn2+ uptake regulation protein
MELELLKSKKIKITEQRLTILKEILNQNKPFSAINLHSKITALQNIDLVTVYRVLSLFKNKNIIREILNSNGEQYFELSIDSSTIHSHFLCEKCKIIYCLNDINSKKILTSANCPKSFIVKNVSLNISGLCNNCVKHLN